MSLNVNIVKDYHPWSAEFVDGTYISRLKNPEEMFSSVLAKAPLLYTFYIHLAWDRVVAVRLSDGLFYKGASLGSTQGWNAHPGHLPNLKYSIYYTRQCSGALVDGHIKASVTGYTLGWTSGEHRRVMYITLDGEHAWGS